MLMEGYMKILAFTFEAPSVFYGGGIGIVQTMASLSRCGDVHYVGPYFNIKDFNDIKLYKTTFFDENASFISKVINTFRGLSVRYFQQWKHFTSSIDSSLYDVVFIDFSYNDYIVDWAHNNNLEAIVRVHNIERDMSFNILKGKKKDKYWLKNVINGYIIAKREKKLMLDADKLVFLTKEDLDRACELYGDSIRAKSFIVPVCMKMNGNNEIAKSSGIEKPYVLTTGSLYYGPNSEGIVWFINEVWNEFLKNPENIEFKLVVAGRKPSIDLKRCIDNSERVILVDSPEDISPYFKDAQFYVAPIFSGAGMKVKVAEALSYGLKVLGTHHALIGYEEAEPFVQLANNKEEFLELMEKEKFNNSSKSDCLKKYESLFTVSRSIEDFSKILK